LAIINLHATESPSPYYGLKEDNCFHNGWLPWDVIHHFRPSGRIQSGGKMCSLRHHPGHADNHTRSKGEDHKHTTYSGNQITASDGMTDLQGI